MRILIAEDTKDFQDMLIDTFIDHDTRVCNDGKEAIMEFLGNNNYDLIITDMQMPICNGLELIAEIRKLNKNIPIILYSGIAFKIEADALSLGATKVFDKTKLPELFDYVNELGG